MRLLLPVDDNIGSTSPNLHPGGAASDMQTNIYHMIVSDKIKSMSKRLEEVIEQEYKPD